MNEFIISIDVIPIHDINGQLVDVDSDNIYDFFENIDTGQQTDFKKENNTFLIDSDGDNKWDYAYDPDTGLLTYYEFVYQKYYIIYQAERAAPGFELISILAVITLLAILLRRKRKNN
jgi:hypothetical protein